MKERMVWTTTLFGFVGVNLWAFAKGDLGDQARRFDHLPVRRLNASAAD